MDSSGDYFERKISKIIHTDKTAVLISSKLLRQYDCGQVDLAYVNNGHLVLAELKSSSIGIQAMKKCQRKRLNRSVALLDSLLGIPVELKFIAKRNSKFYP